MLPQDLYDGDIEYKLWPTVNEHCQLIIDLRKDVQKKIAIENGF